MSLATNLQTAFTRIGTEFKSIRVLISGSGTGTVSGLNTTSTNLVGAINEVKAVADSAGGGGWAAVDASATVKGIVELATPAETTAGADTTRAVTPQGVAAAIAAFPSASETVAGKVELATLVETATGTDPLRVVTVAGLRQERLAVKAEILGAGVPAALDTLDELAAALADDAAYSATVTTALGNRVRVDTAAQGLTTPQQANARTNIDAASATDVGPTTTDFVATFNAGLI